MDQIAAWAKALLDKLAQYQLTGQMLDAALVWSLDKGAALLTAVNQPALAAQLALAKALLSSGSPFVTAVMDFLAAMLNDLIGYLKTITLDYFPKVLTLASLAQGTPVQAPAAA